MVVGCRNYIVRRRDYIGALSFSQPVTDAPCLNEYLYQ